VSNKQTIATNIYMNGDDIGQVRQDVNQTDWEWGVDNALKNLIQVAPFQSSKPVLDMIGRQTRGKILIRPAHPGEEVHSEPVKGIDTFDNVTPNWRNATPADLPPLKCAEGEVAGRDQTGTPLFRRGDGSDPNRLGTGTGSDVCLYFTSQDYHWHQQNKPGGRPDEALLHELVHSLRMTLALTLCLAMGDDYDTVEEFHAILIANIYRSECGYQNLRANHFGKTNLADTDDTRFYARYRDQIDSFAAQPWMKDLCRSIALVACKFNPIRRALVTPDGRLK
jgi:hypothetical protein